MFGRQVSRTRYSDILLPGLIYYFFISVCATHTNSPMATPTQAMQDYITSLAGQYEEREDSRVVSEAPLERQVEVYISRRAG